MKIFLTILFSIFLVNVEALFAEKSTELSEDAHSVSQVTQSQPVADAPQKLGTSETAQNTTTVKTDRSQEKASEKNEHSHSEHQSDPHDPQGKSTFNHQSSEPEIEGVDFLVADTKHIEQYLSLPGKVILNPDTSSHINARYAGIVKKVYKSIGEKVKKGDVLAQIESNVAIQTYNIRATEDGEIVLKDISVGEYVDTERLIFSIANLETVWVKLILREDEARRLKQNNFLSITDRKALNIAQGNLSYISPVLDPHSRTADAILLLNNENRKWKPGQLVDGYFQIDSKEVPLAVSKKAIRHEDGKVVIYVKDGDHVDRKIATLGDRDLSWVEVKEGLKAGEQYLVGEPEAVALYVRKNVKNHEEEHEHGEDEASSKHSSEHSGEKGHEH